MKKVVALAAVVLALTAGPAAAQGKVEVSGLFGWTVSDGVTGSPIKAPDGNTYSAVDVKDGMNWGLMFGIMASDNFEFGFMFNQQMSALRLEGTTNRELGDMAINGYHGYFAVNFGDPESKVRPYFLGGIGATSYGSVNYTNAAGSPASTGGDTQFSTTWGVGVKIYPSPRLGFRAGIRWTPTYIKSDPGGWWCDPYWGCYLVANAQYSNQFEFSGGVTVRF